MSSEDHIAWTAAIESARDVLRLTAELAQVKRERDELRQALEGLLAAVGHRGKPRGTVTAAMERILEVAGLDLPQVREGGHE